MLDEEMAQLSIAMEAMHLHADDVPDEAVHYIPVPMDSGPTQDEVIDIFPLADPVGFSPCLTLSLVRSWIVESRRQRWGAGSVDTRSQGLILAVHVAIVWSHTRGAHGRRNWEVTDGSRLRRGK